MLSNSLKNISAHSDAFNNQVVGKPRLLPLLRNEWRFYRVQPLCWLALCLALAFAALATIGNDLQTAQPQKELLFTHTKLLMMLQVLLIGALAPLAFLRDRQHGMTELTGVTPLTDWQWCCSRAGGLLMVVLGVQILLQFLAIAGVWFGINPQATAVTLASLCWISLQLFLLQQLPALLLLVALQLWCSRKTPHPALLYLLTAVCWLGYVLLAAATGSPVMAKSQPVSPWLSQLMLYLDPYALTPWLVQLQNSASITPDATVLLNRLLIVGSSALLFWRAWAAKPSLSKLQSTKFQFRTATNSAPAIEDSHSLGGSNSGQPQTADFRTVTPASSNWQSFGSLLRLQWLQLLRQRSTVLALLLLIGLVFSEVFTGLGYAEALSRLQPDSRDALNRINWDVLPRFGLLLLAFWASQLSWLNRQLRFDSLIAATPVSGVVQLCSQLAVLWLLTLLLVVLSFSAVAMAQLLSHIPIQFDEYLQQGLFTLSPLLLWGMLLLACHALLRSPLRANAVVAVLLLFGLSPLPDMLELQHPLWRVGQTQLAMPDALWGYQGSVGSTIASTIANDSASGHFSNGGFWPYLVFWGLLALTLWLLAMQHYHRGTGTSAPRQRLSNPFGLFAAVLAMLWLTQGLHIHQQLQQAGALETPQQRQAQRAAYEQLYQQWQHQPQPVVSKVQLQVGLYPAAQQATIAATLTLTNPHSTPITQLLVTLPGDIADQQALQSIDLDGAQLIPQQIPQKTEHQQRIYQFDQPLASGATTQLTVNLQLTQHAIATSPMHQVLRSEFSYLRLLHLLPQVGFMPELRLRDAKTRAEFGLAPLPEAETQPSVLAATATPASARYDWAQLETIISVPQGYQGIAAGKLIRQWQQQNRQYFHYKTTDAVRNLPAVIAVPWQPQQAIQDGIQLEIYSPTYNAATELNMQAMQQTLHWFSQQVGAYPGDALRLVMMPDVGPTGYALPQLVLINHRVGVRAVAAADAGFSQVYRRAVHEVAHQWFGHGIGNGVPGDGAFLVESLAKYAELVLIEQHFGIDAMQALVDFEQQRYSRALAGSRSEQKSLVDADESYDQYSRATLVFAKLRATVGDAVITAALRQLWQQHRYPATPASAMDFVRALQAHSPQSAQPLIHSLLLTKDSSMLVD
ncbi:hypothetical protein EOE67_07835 [Rheinheimera riviphila]|uniref:Peptidase M1 membrane alanine aminopeptidase domain-containing protein n=1 Tax=Rheinheimera riviphila TaxID=1834037 RepID=A0A437R098_9GAMM|nr:M1 family aminopeptidase [Rheinheimera riviphila]RVU40151.1 hypothetical protein EOE67_07835 [Rheinheimera riviphila]